MADSFAGHFFQDTPQGEVCGCGKRLVDVINATEDDIDHPEKAHYGDLTRHEYDQIVAARESRWERGRL